MGTITLVINPSEVSGKIQTSGSGSPLSVVDSYQTQSFCFPILNRTPSTTMSQKFGGIEAKTKT